jgi:hypothetical protein
VVSAAVVDGRIDVLSRQAAQAPRRLNAFLFGDLWINHDDDARASS